jgi:hypothetical protein
MLEVLGAATYKGELLESTQLLKKIKRRHMNDLTNV